MDTPNQQRMKIIVTGAAGNIGEILCPYLRKCGHSVLGIDIKQAVGDDYITADINQPADLLEIFVNFNPDVVIHMAAMVSRVTSERSPTMTIQTNVGGTANIIRLCKLIGAKLINFSTSEVYGNTGGMLHESAEPKPNNIYGLSKWLAEQLVAYHVTTGLDAITVRPFMFYHENETIGDHRSAMIRFVHDALTGKKLNVHRASIRSWLHLDDGVVIIEKLCHSKGFHTVNIGHDHPVLTSDLAAVVCRMCGREPFDLIELSDLPERMTLTKYPSLQTQYALTEYEPKIDIESGIRRVIETVKKRLSCISY